MAGVAPIPSANATTTVIVNPGANTNCRNACLRSLSISPPQSAAAVGRKSSAEGRYAEDRKLVPLDVRVGRGVSRNQRMDAYLAGAGTRWLPTHSEQRPPSQA